MPKVAAIDIGSNGIRLAIGRLDSENRLELLHSSREALRLGSDVFQTQIISEELIARSKDVFMRFKQQMDTLEVERVRAVATSAMREAHNRDDFFSAIMQSSDIHVELISGLEEARLVHLAVAQSVVLGDKSSLLVDVGGGSVEITLTDKSGILATDSYKMGTVRLLQMQQDSNVSGKKFQRMVEEYVKAARRRIRKEIGKREIDILVGTGGNCDCLASMSVELLKKEDRSQVTLKELIQLIDMLSAMSFQQRVAELRLRPDRADVILPAAIVLQAIMRMTGVKAMQVPGVGLKNGVLIDMLDDLRRRKTNLHYHEVVAAAVRLGQKFDVDLAHAQTVARLAVSLFDQTVELHGLGQEYRMMLEVAALLHEVGAYVSPIGYHKHTQYLISNNPLLGSNDEQMNVVAALARYSRKSLPKKSHVEFQSLSDDRKESLRLLIPWLRLAIALDEERSHATERVTVKLSKKQIELTLSGAGDLYLETWSAVKLSTLVDEVYGKTLTVHSDSSLNVTTELDT